MLKVTDNSNEQEESSIECFRCGICCSRYQVRLNQIEAKRIASELGIPWKEFITNYTDRRWPGAESFLLRHNHGACIFLSPDKVAEITTCLIYPFRPSSCQKWRPSQYRTECQEGLHKYWGLNISPDGKLKGNITSIRRFQTFLKSLK
jgi:Fe-S-cluster containining protein